MSREVHVPFYERLGVQFPRSTHRFCLSFRDAEDLLAQRGIVVTYETIRQWCRMFGPAYARALRRRRGRMGDTWHLDELFVNLQGQRQHLWRAVDEDGDVIDILVQSRRNRRAAMRFFRRLLTKPTERKFLTSPLASASGRCDGSNPVLTRSDSYQCTDWCSICFASVVTCSVPPTIASREPAPSWSGRR